MHIFLTPNQQQPLYYAKADANIKNFIVFIFFLYLSFIIYFFSLKMKMSKKDCFLYLYF